MWIKEKGEGGGNNELGARMNHVHERKQWEHKSIQAAAAHRLGILVYGIECSSVFGSYDIEIVAFSHF